MTYIYHGSKNRLDLLEPNQAFGFGGDSDCQNGVYGVLDKELAIPFTFSIVNAKVNSIFRVDTELKPPKVILVNCEIDWSKIGFLYKLSAVSFEQLDKCQWVSKIPVKPLEVIEIDPKDYKHWVTFENT